MTFITEMEEIMSEQTTAATTLASLAERAAADSDWWKQPDQRNALELPTRVLHVLDDAGIRTVEQLKAAGPQSPAQARRHRQARLSADR